MTGAIIKAGRGQDRVGSLLAQGGTDATPAPTRLVRDHELETLLAENAALRAELDALNRNQIKELERARDDARAKAVSAFKRDEDAILAALTAATEHSARRVQAGFEQLETAIPALAVEALKPLLKTPETYRHLIEDAVGRQLAELQDGTILEVVVSGADFTDSGAVRDLAALTGTNIRIDPKAEAGSVRSRLKLGWLECSIPSYWQELQELVSAACDGVDAR